VSVRIDCQLEFEVNLFLTDLVMHVAILLDDARDNDVYSVLCTCYSTLRCSYLVLNLI
jgi:hypothetical protein